MLGLFLWVNPSKFMHGVPVTLTGESPRRAQHHPSRSLLLHKSLCNLVLSLFCSAKDDEEKGKVLTDDLTCPVFNVNLCLCSLHKEIWLVFQVTHGSTLINDTPAWTQIRFPAWHCQDYRVLYLIIVITTLVGPSSGCPDSQGWPLHPSSELLERWLVRQHGCWPLIGWGSVPGPGYCVWLYVYVTHTHLAIIVFRIRMLFIDLISLIVWLEYNKKTCNIMIYDSRAPME